jgi:membrane-associated protease RseP (regulator of RpoE activity)
LAAEEAQPAQPESSAATRIVRVVVSAKHGSHWLGIMAIPVDEGLKSHLKVGERLMVQQTVPDSPAAKAGVKQYDILLKFGDQEIRSLPDLQKAVEANVDKESPLTVLREGAEQKLSIKPEARPSQTTSLEAVPEVRQLEDRVLRWMEEKGGIWRPDQSMKMQFFGPGFLHSAAEFPSELSVSISKEGNNPAKITVQRKDDKWEVTDESLDKLPADVRPHIERLLGRGDMLLHVSPPGINVVPPVPPLPSVPEKVHKNLRLELRGSGGMEELRKEMDQLRKELDQLKQQSGKAQEEKKAEN